MKKNISLILVLIVLGAHLACGTAEAASPWDTILNAINGLATKVDTIKNMVSGLQLSVNVNVGFCGEDAAVQCTDSGPGSGEGHTFEAASSSNHNPVLITVLVTRMDGSQVDGIPSENFLWDQSIGPGPGIERCGDLQDNVGCGSFTSSYFIYLGNGVYTFVVHPSAVGYNWKVAKYGFVLTVIDNNDGNQGRALGEIVIKQ